ncbi:MAG: hypothetical protein AVDCRST_MAG32-1595 [uncultured Nocardioides sp.]|uniref:N-acetyltransferase domain-containing protein n=1 Tax=uncultured Nocardioides sp. TaxID=198441 RepID=A0A6J4N7J6_9ACTN|nr:MAG: hypothetical protein AVDCRST_MAG32-1595 [uncultured Nocardioides sp.]
MPDPRIAVATLRQQARRRLELGLVSRSARYGLRRDLRAPHQHPSAKIELIVRPMRPEDAVSLYGDDQASTADKMELHWRRRYVDEQLARGWVAVDVESNRPCYVQWLLPQSENAFITQAGDFPALARDEALLENAFTPAAYRGKGIMSAAMSRIAEQAEQYGARYVMTFVGDDNIASLKGCQRAGFAPHLVHHRTRRAFGVLNSSRFETLAEDDPRRHRFLPDQ